MKRFYTDNAQDDLIFIKKNNQKNLIDKIGKLLDDIELHGVSEGIGKPEQLSGDLKGYYSRRITKKERLVYTVVEDTIVILQCRTHYKDK
ncbi:MAG: Txe/YoeB family addiction module toxin [Elusimicrobiota bacterium]|jgi:toxin YoeB|nr:Txe/YoeB family addiction module toxin [Elusimicrobiota bacterium]